MQPISKLFRAYQNLIISIALLLFCLIATFTAVLPSARNVQELLSDREDLSAQTNALNKKRDALSLLDEETLRGKLVNVLSAVPADRSFPTLFETVEAVAAQAGVAVGDMNIRGGTSLATPSAAQRSASERKLGTRTIPFSVTVNGNLDNVEQFITRVSGVRRLLRVRAFSITFPNELHPLTVMIEMDGFYEPLPATLGSAKADLPSLTEQDEVVVERLTKLPLVVGGSTSLPPPLIGSGKEDPFSP